MRAAINKQLANDIINEQLANDINKQLANAKKDTINNPGFFFGG